MSTARKNRWRLLGAATAVACVAGSLLLGPAPAGADQVAIDRTFADHTMGSQIRRVEGDSSNEGTKQAARQPQGLNSDGVSATATVEGIDVARYQGNVDWAGQWNAGRRFAYVKATESTTYTNPYFAQQYNGSYDVGMIRGAYHFATPDTASGAAQANYFVDHGGGWSGDGKTLPGALDMEYNPYGSTCYGMSQGSMASWVRDFHDTYHARTGRWPVIYTSASWWNQCVGGAQSFGDTVPLWVARYSSSVGALPSGWGFHTIWQYSSDPIDQDSFNGAYDRLQALAAG